MYEKNRRAWKEAEDGFRINAAVMLMVLHQQPFGFGQVRMKRLVKETRKLMLTFKSPEDAVEQCRARTKWAYPGINYKGHYRKGTWIEKQANYSMAQVEKGFSAMMIVLKEQFRISREKLEKTLDMQNNIHGKVLEDVHGDVDAFAYKVREAFRATYFCDLDPLFDEELEEDAIFAEDVSLEID